MAKNFLEDHNIRLALGQTVQAVAEMVTPVTDKETFDVDMVILAVGFVLIHSSLSDGKIELSATVLPDNKKRQFPGVYAVGDRVD